MQKTQTGYALLEVMIAIAMVSLALPALVLTVYEVMSQTAEVKIDSMAQWEALNQLEVLKINTELTGKLGNGEQPLQDIYPSTDNQWQGKIVIENSPMEGIQRVTVDVGLEADEPRASLVAFINLPNEQENEQRGNN